MMVNSNREPSALLNRILFRSVQPTDIPRCHQIEAASYPEDEAASKSTLQYRQHHAAPFFRCAFLVGDFENPGSGTPGGTTSASSSISYQGQSVNLGATLRGTIIGFICSTRCKSFAAEAMKVHDASGKILAIHSVVVEKQYRNCGVASAMLQDYVSAMERLNSKGILKVKMEKIVLMAKNNFLAFYVKNGFMAIRESPVVHGKERWFELEKKFDSSEESNSKTHECFIVDSFADVDKQGSGNPAAVVLLSGPPGKEQSISASNGSDTDNSLDEMDGETDEKNVQDRGVDWMATVAKEFNQSETAFVWPLPHKASLDDERLCLQQKNAQLPAYAIRYYTRTGVEVDLCGHATLAAASVLFHPKKIEDPKQNHKVSFFTKKDVYLQAELLVPPANSQLITPVLSSNKASRVSMKFPWKNVTPLSPEKDSREEVLGILSRAFSDSSNLGQSSKFSASSFAQYVLHIGITHGNEDMLIELTEEGFDLLRGVRVDYRALTVYQGYSRGVIICCCASMTPAIDFRSRFFGPKVGIDEDPVTGSAHCSLGPYFGNKLRKAVVVGRQESDRGGLVECILKPDEGRVCIVGTSVMTVSGQLSITM
mmetsp:Transcript_36126/g.77036  ORF Transcript_36126/g.77036 Transcript_36126/m.77036 type:complete len:597 (+) Transcript_36126:106-1896(+)|eukprot:CAMPEP_0172554264 /NCGR_PEP_ID=MMETSP1067-20121228/53832_1 /TAXON_ID=265564 ORGANISM="Thalassiosira punctigera, Strain Tpunct2005C2" /NCGR_SAMPLE_ID=MMETSP1067 /ASSEMBLY_ACC=CAM_ASM_000444 /LENGTH=596 /DNA_ID=CAMNT_0013342597 /DNA_START=81 /DNA_END=1871 /DNA_ORIENTATION=+